MVTATDDLSLQTLQSYTSALTLSLEDIGIPSPGNFSTLLSLQETWKAGIWGSGIGKSGFVTTDIDNDGEIEIIAAGSTSTFGANNFWYILKYDSTSQQYSQQWLSNNYSADISKIAAFDVDHDGIYSIFVGLDNGEIKIYNGKTLTEVASLNSSTSSINQILYADADNDSVKELVLTDGANTFIYNATTFALEHQLPYGASDLEIGNVDADSAHEIVLANGKVLEFDGITTTVEWDNPGGDFGYLIELSDFDSDGMSEIIGASSWYYVTAFDAELQSPKWQISTDHDVDALLVTDVDNDGIEEVLYGDGQWGEIHTYDPITVTEKWQLPNPDHGVTNIAVFDTDGDGDLEVLWGAGASSTGADHLYVHGIPDLSREWQSQHIDGPFHAIDVGDVDSDGQQEIVFVSFESGSGYDDGTVFVYDAQTHALEWQSPENLFGGGAWTGIHDVKIGDVDDDGNQEIVVATDNFYDGALYIIDGTTKEMEQSYFYDDGSPLYSIDIADVDNDGQTEIIAGAGREHTGSPGVYVYVINGSTGEVEWHSINLGDYWSQISGVAVDDIDNDQVPEIVAINDNLFVFDGISHQQWQSSFNGVESLELYDTDNDGIKEMLVGTNDGNIMAIDGQTLEEEINVHVSDSSIVGLKASDISSTGNTELIFTSAGSLGIYSLEESTLLWESENLGSSAGEFNSLVVANFDSDESREILVGTNNSVVEFEDETPSQTLEGTEGDDLIYASDGNGSLYGYGGNDTLLGAKGEDTIYGGAGNDLIVGGQAFDSLWGGAGNDILNGGKGNDTLVGASGTDFLRGNAGNDILRGGGGADKLFGGRGADIFRIGQGTDTINDFVDGTDSFGLTGTLTFGQLTIVDNGGNAEILVTATSDIIGIVEGVSASLITVEDFFETHS